MSTPETVGPPYDPKDPEMAVEFLESLFRNVIDGELPHMDREAIDLTLSEIGSVSFDLYFTYFDRPDLTFQPHEVKFTGDKTSGEVGFADGTQLVGLYFRIQPASLYNEGKP